MCEIIKMFRRNPIGVRFHEDADSMAHIRDRGVTPSASSIICKICFDPYSHTDERRPHVIQCGHSLCMKCIKELFKNQAGGIKCPFCNQFSRYGGSH